MPHAPRLLIVDNSPRHLGAAWFGRWLRALGSEVAAYHAWSGSLPGSLDGFDGVVLSGSPASALQEDDWIRAELRLIEQAEQRRLPLLGACFGGQLLARAYYGKGAVRASPQAEFGWHAVALCGQDALTDGAPRAFTSFQFHREEVVPQRGMKVLATSPASAVQAYRIGRQPVWGLQCHLEVTPRAGRDFLRKTEAVYRPHGLRYDELVRAARPCAATAPVLANFVKLARG